MAAQAHRAETRPNRTRCCCRSRAGAGRGESRAPPGGGGGGATGEKRKAACTLTRGNRGGAMAEERSHDLERRRDELTRSLPGLSEKRADTYRLNSDALALDRAGV